MHGVGAAPVRELKEGEGYHPGHSEDAPRLEGDGPVVAPPGDSRVQRFRTVNACGYTYVSGTREEVTKVFQVTTENGDHVRTDLFIRWSLSIRQSPYKRAFGLPYTELEWTVSCFNSDEWIRAVGAGGGLERVKKRDSLRRDKHCSVLVVWRTKCL